MTKILMVCLGNICRSPLAEGIMRSKINKYTLDAEVDSAGTAAFHVGEAPDIRSIREARKNQIDLSKQKARKFQASDFEYFDKIYAMDQSNLQDILALAPNPEAAQKAQLILEEIHPGSHWEVPDPYYGGDEGFREVFEMLDKACEQIALHLKNGK